MKTVMFFFVMLVAFPASRGTAAMPTHMGGGNSYGVSGEIRMQLSESGNNEDDPATDDGEDLRDGDSDSNSNDDSDRDDG